MLPYNLPIAVVTVLLYGWPAGCCLEVVASVRREAKGARVPGYDLDYFPHNRCSYKMSEDSKVSSLCNSWTTVQYIR